MNGVTWMFPLSPVGRGREELLPLPIPRSPWLRHWIHSLISVLNMLNQLQRKRLPISWLLFSKYSDRISQWSIYNPSENYCLSSLSNPWTTSQGNYSCWWCQQFWYFFLVKTIFGANTCIYSHVFIQFLIQP